MRPVWLQTATQAPSTLWLERARASLDEPPNLLCVVGGSPGARRGSAAALSHGQLTLGTALSGCRDEYDVVRALGFALDLPLPGDATAVAERLRQLGRPLVVLDAADGPEGLLHALQTLRAMALGARWLLLSETSLGASAELPPEGQGQREDPCPELVELDQRAPELLWSEGAVLLELAVGAPLREAPTHRDVLLLRSLARRHAAPSARAIAASAAARLTAGCGQLPLARALLEKARLLELGARELALLDWASGDILAAYGLLGEATRTHARALDRLKLIDEPALEAAMLRASADRLAVRGHRAEAAERLRRARSLQRRAGNLLGVAASLRRSADGALAAGELIEAQALYAQAAEILDDLPPPEGDLERAGLRLGEAGLAIVQGDLRAAESRLEEARVLGLGSPLVAAATDRRQADLLVRRGRHQEAMDLLAEAIPLLQRVGQREAAAAAIRLRGDVAAAAGDHDEAARHYQLAVVEAVKVGDLLGARRSLHHQLTLERTGSDSVRVEELLEQLDGLDTELGAPIRADELRLPG
jgi:hypothetical protein